MPQIAARFLPADPARVNREHHPRLPDWWPLPGAKVLRRDPEDEATLDESPANRARVRWAQALKEACEGPHDSPTLMQVEYRGAEPPPTLTVDDGRTTYVRSDAESNRHVAVYRYSPGDSLGHALYMRAVEDGYAEYGRTYAEGARHDDPQHDSVPPGLF